MNDDIQHAIEHLRDPASRPWFRDRCAQWPQRQRELHAIVAASGLAVRPLREPLVDARPDVWVDVEPISYDRDGFRAEYRASLRGSLVANVFTVDYTAVIDNAAPGRLHPYCKVAAKTPLIAAHRAIETEVVPALARLGWRRTSLDEEDEFVEGIGRVGSRLERDVNGWLDDNEPMAPPDRSHLQPYLETLARRYATQDAIRNAADASPPWIDDIVAIVVGTRATQLTPASYPSTSWTIDYGEVANRAFDARFFTDLHVSKLAPVWYYSDRFVMAHPNPEATQPELSGWMIDEISYLAEQTEMVAAVRSTLARHDIVELDDYDLRMPVPSPYGGFAMLGELLFRDALGVFPPAPRVDEEGIDRNLRPRIGHLR